MQLHDLRPTHKVHRAKRVGRGGKRGTYSGRGLKGQKSRAGYKIRPAVRDLVKKIPKLKGIEFPRLPQTQLRKSVIVSVGELEKTFQKGERVNPKTLIEKGLVRKRLGRWPVIKLLGDGTITKKLLVSQCQISKSAREKIEKAGGSVAL